LHGNKLPSERELIKEFGVSRITIKKAIANLVNQDLVIGDREKGIFVNKNRKVAYNLATHLTFLEDDLARKEIELSIQNIIFEPVVASKEIQKLEVALVILC
jgi:GntR family transcriptional regulator